MTVLLDTNVVSELMRKSPRPAAYADIASRRRSAGRPVAPPDCQIAAIARSRAMAVATRNVRDFENMGIEVVDPWSGA
ncbi:hypothetical protein [Candidatus Palauibacter sp.]|uniref:hypothetical protein n=1 Tax=Candidatus Palauibacter sp. TaxID=3101350 RepID=UPI003AF2484A